MALERVTQLLSRVANDPADLSALSENPALSLQPKQLGDAHLRALISAGAFSSVKPAATTSEPDFAFVAGGAPTGLGTLQPPEGSGDLPDPNELPPTLAPVNTPVPVPSKTPALNPAPPPIGPVPNPAPKGGNSPGPGAVPLAGPPPHGLSQSPSPKSVNSPGPGANPLPGPTPVPQAVPTSVAAPIPQSGPVPYGVNNPGQAPVRTAPAPAGLSSQTNIGRGGSSSQAAPGPSAAGRVAAYVAPGSATSYTAQPGGQPAGCCPCATAILAIVAQTAITSQTAMASIVAMAATT
jgi:hypothetical protein